MKFILLSIFITLFVISHVECGLKAGDCEVCISVLDRFKNSLNKDEISKPNVIENKFKEFCEDLKLKENRFCYYLGGTADAATGILGEMSKPLSWGMPAEKVCEKHGSKKRSKV